MILDLHRQGLSPTAIARQLGIDRKTVRKYIARGMDPPNYRAQPRRPRRTDDFLPYLRERLAAYPGLSAVRLLRELRERGFDGGYTAVKRAVQEIRPERERRFEVRFETPPGEQAQVDFARFEVVFADEPGTKRIVWLFSMVLGFSRLIWARFVVHQDLQSVLRCHVAAFAAIGGAPREILYDRMKTAVIGEDADGLVVYNRSLIDLARHFGFHPKACRPYRAKTKGKVERPFRYIRQDFYLAGSFRNLDDLNAQLRHWLDTVANPRTHATTKRVVNEAFAEERTGAASTAAGALPRRAEAGAARLARRHDQRRRQCLQRARHRAPPGARRALPDRRGADLRGRRADRAPCATAWAWPELHRSRTPQAVAAVADRHRRQRRRGRAAPATWSRAARSNSTTRSAASWR